MHENSIPGRGSFFRRNREWTKRNGANHWFAPFLVFLSTDSDSKTIPEFSILKSVITKEENHAIYSNQQAISIAEENCLRFFEKLLEKGVQIIEKNVRIDMIGEECVAEGTITVIGPIAQSVPIAENTVHQEETNN